MPMPTEKRSTPWGREQTRREVAEGITFYSTASHGGYHLSPERFAKFREYFPDFGLWAGDPWFEEDCDAALVVVTFPDLFTDEQVYNAVEGIAACVRNKGESSQQWTLVWLRIGQADLLACLTRSGSFRLDHLHHWQTGSMSTNGKGWNVWLTRVRDGAQHVKFFESYPEKQFYTESEVFSHAA
jgi:hypothetical protein